MAKTTTGTGNSKYYIVGGSGDDTIYAIDSKYDSYYRDNLLVTIDGSTGKDLIFGRTNDEILLGSAGSDWLNGGGGNDKLDGGTGTTVDWITFQSYRFNNTTYNAYFDGVTVSLVQSAYRYETLVGNRGGDALNFENVYGSDGADKITGDANNNELAGGSGNDTIVGNLGNDAIYGGDGNDQIALGYWSPWLNDSPLAASVMRKGSDNNTADGGSGDDLIISAAGNDWIDGGAGYDIADYSYLPQGFFVRVSLDGPNWVKASVYTIVNGLEVSYEQDWLRNIEGVNGGVGEDSLIGDPNRSNTMDGGPGDDNLTGGNLDDTLDGGIDDDNLDGGAGNDKLIGSGGGNDNFKGGDGEDLISFAPVPTEKYDPCASLPGDTKSLVIDLANGDYSFKQNPDAAIWYGAVNGIENVLGAKCGDQIAGDGGTNILDGNGGADLLYGAGGNDILRGGAGSDWAAFRAVTKGNLPSDHFTLGGGIAPASMLMTSATIGALEEDPYAAGMTVNLSNQGGWYQYGFAGTKLEASGVENILGSTGDDLLIGDRAAYMIFAGGAAKLIVGRTLSFDYNGQSYSGVLSQSDITALQNATLPNGGFDVSAITGLGSLGSGKVLASLVNGDLRLVAANASTGSAVNLLTEGRLTDGETSGITATSSGTNYLGFLGVAPTISAGDKITFAGSGTHVITADQATELLAGGEVILSPDYKAVVYNTNNLRIFSTSVSFTGGTYHNILVADAQEAGVNNFIAGDDGFDVITAGFGDDTIFGGGDVGFDIHDPELPGNSLTGGNGSDTFYTGWTYDPILDNTDGVGNGRVAVAGTDIIHDWDNDNGGTAAGGSLGRDSLDVSTLGTAVIRGLAGKANWDGNDTVDLLNNVENDGKIVVFTGKGEDTIYGSNGEDWVYAGAGHDVLSLGAGTGDGSDRVYISSFQSNYLVTGFDSEDKIFIDRQMVDSFANAAGKGKSFQVDVDLNIDFEAALRGDFAHFIDFNTASEWVLRADPTLADAKYYRDDTGAYTTAGANPNTYRNVLIDAGQEVDAGTLSSPIYNLVYDKTVGAFDGIYGDNGAYSNFAHDIAYIAAQGSVAGVAALLIGIGIGVSYIPFIGPLLAIPFFVTAGILTYEIIVENEQHLNPLYQANVNFLDTVYEVPDNGGPDATTRETKPEATYIASFNQGDFPYLTYMKALADLSGAASAGQRDDFQFLQFYNPPQDRFTPSLEVENGIWDYAPFLSEQGIYTVAVLQTGRDTASETDDKSFIYLITSPDHLIQNNETYLLAEVDGFVSPDQVKFFDGSAETEHTQYGSSDFVAPVFPPKPGLGFIKADSAVVSGRASTNTSSAQLRVHLDAPTENVTAILYRDGVELKSWAVSSGTVLEEDYTDASGFGTDTTFDYQFVVISSQGIQRSAGLTLIVDIIGPEIETFGVSDAGLAISANENIVSAKAYSATPALVDSETYAEPARSALIDLAPQPNIVRIASYELVDEAGNTSTQNAGSAIGTGANAPTVPFVWLGTIGNDAITATSGQNSALYGFGGVDTLTGSTGNDSLFGGDGADILDGGTGDDVLSAGLGADSMTGGSGADIFVWGADAKFGEGVTITDFVSGTDLLQFSAENIGWEQFKDVPVLDDDGDPVLLSAGPDKLLDTADDEFQTSEVADFTAANFKAGAGLSALVAGDESVRFFYDSTDGKLYFDADGFGGVDAQLVVTLSKIGDVAPTLVYTDLTIA